MRFIDSTPHRLRSFAFGTLLALVVAACTDTESPTAPRDAGAHPPTPTVAPTFSPPHDLTGTWSGTVTVLYDDPPGGCSGPADATFVQTGSAVSGTLTGSPGCSGYDKFTFEGTLEGAFLNGRIILPSSIYPASGVATDSHIAVSAFNVYWELGR